MELPDESHRRLFIGLGLDEEGAERLMRRVRPFLDGEGIRVYEPRDLHLTLGFLGSFPEERRPQLQRILQEEIRGLDAPELVLGGIGAFPSNEEPVAVYVGVKESDEVPGRLWALRNRAWQAALSLGWRPQPAERRGSFRPHVTVARMPRGSSAPLDAGLARLDFDQRWLPVDVHVVESRPGRPEERYRSLAAIPLVVRPG